MLDLARWPSGLPVGHRANWPTGQELLFQSEVRRNRCEIAYCEDAEAEGNENKYQQLELMNGRLTKERAAGQALERWPRGIIGYESG